MPNDSEDAAAGHNGKQVLLGMCLRGLATRPVAVIDQQDFESFQYVESPAQAWDIIQAHYAEKPIPG